MQLEQLDSLVKQAWRVAKEELDWIETGIDEIRGFIPAILKESNNGTNLSILLMLLFLYHTADQQLTSADSQDHAVLSSETILVETELSPDSIDSEMQSMEITGSMGIDELRPGDYILVEKIVSNDAGVAAPKQYWVEVEEVVWLNDENGSQVSYVLGTSVDTGELNGYDLHEIRYIAERTQ